MSMFTPNEPASPPASPAIEPGGLTKPYGEVAAACGAAITGVRPAVVRL
jgi:hypothetical protein